MANLDDLLRGLAGMEASDLHVSESAPPFVRIDGTLRPLEGHESQTGPAVREALLRILPEPHRRRFDARNETDFGYELAGAGRFRCSVFADRNGMNGAFRRIPETPQSLERLGVPPAVQDLAGLARGIVLVTGPAGSGRSTLLAAMADHVNRTRCVHLLTLEDPVEFHYPAGKSLITQRELLRHTESYASALRSAAREDADVVLVGELADKESIRLALEAAESGRLLFCAAGTRTSAEAIDRLAGFLPDAGARTMLAASLKGVIAQTLVRKTSGGRVAAREILIVTPAVEAMIRDGKTHMITGALQTGARWGMTTLDHSLFGLVQSGVVDPDEALAHAVDRRGFSERLKTLA